MSTLYAFFYTTVQPRSSEFPKSSRNTMQAWITLEQASLLLQTICSKEACGGEILDDRGFIQDLSYFCCKLTIKPPSLYTCKDIRCKLTNWPCPQKCEISEFHSNQTFAVFCQIIIQPLAILFGGHMGRVALSTLGLANSIISVVCNTMFLGLTCACDTLFSHVKGSDNNVYLGILVQRSIVAFTLVTFIMYGINLNMATFLIATSQEPVVSVLVGRYLLWFMPAVPGETKSFCASGLVGVILALIFNILLVNVAEFRLNGSASAQDIAYVLSTAGYIMYIVRLDFHRQNWPGLLGSVELSAQSIVFNLDMMLYALPEGLGITCAIRVGQCMGAGRPAEARSACYLALSCIFFTTLVPTTLYATLRNELPKIFTDDEEVIALAAELLPFVAFYNIFMNISIVMNGFLRGIGKQRVGSVVVTVGYYVIALPIGGSLMFLTALRTKGIWIAFCATLVLNTFIYTIYLTRFVDWGELSRLAQKRTQGGRKPAEIDESVESLFANESSNTADWMNAVMPRDLKIRSALYIAMPIAFFIFCVLFKLFNSYDEDAILMILQEYSIGLNSTTAFHLNTTLSE
ncbi:hypothetical protein CAPTEDRAFT_229240 [Capitella teleta]|uniref:Multidrug and toxin extrusion protein n=1 Tax=Capitella teleta TaxID=283909 RepID=R7V526_CAPTE|nr:hypothetical protein CAPTEDRAFT_229240 [Capitella teleta]|eukprot:ELU13562.1 hypothetical protein CAPTEDRAFT_229240 [Capitella teleta]